MANAFVRIASAFVEARTQALGHDVHVHWFPRRQCVVMKSHWVTGLRAFAPTVFFERSVRTFSTELIPLYHSLAYNSAARHK